MDLKLILIPAAIILIGIVVMIFLNKKGNRSAGVAQDVMKNFVIGQLPNMKNTYFDVINILEDSVNAQHIWVVAYNNDGMFLIPSLSNPLTQTIKRYEDLTPAFDLKGELAANLFVGNKSENIDYVPFSAVTNVLINEDTKKIQISIGNTTKDFKYQNKDCFGADQEEVLNKFIKRLNSI